MADIKVNVDSLRTGREWVRHKVQKGSNVYRILPPFGDVEKHNNYPFKRWVVAWLIDPKTNKRMPFASPFSAGEEACPVHEYTKALAEKIDNFKSVLASKGLSASEIKEKLAPLNKIAWEIKLQKTFAYNACDKAGKVGILEIKTNAQKDMKKRMLEYITEREMDPTSLNSDLKNDAGVWFNILREGEMKDTTYSVDFNKSGVKDAEGDIVYKLDRSALPENVVDGFHKNGYDLFSVYRQKTYAELREILMYNLSLIADEVPHALVPGFELEEAPVKAVAAVVEEEPVVAAKPKAKVAISLGDDDDDDDFVSAPVAKKAAAPAPRKADASLDDLMSLADDLLGD